jgi:hypothetical protein
MKVNDVFPSKYVKGAELPPHGMMITIQSVQPEKMRRPGQGSEVDGWVLWAAGAKRAIVLTPALARQIAQVLDEQEMDKWAGQQVVIYPEPMMVAGSARVAIRARASLPRQKGF